MGAVPVTIGSGPTAEFERATPDPLRFRFGHGDAGDDYDIAVFNVGLACCAVEFVAATMHAQGFTDPGAAASPAEDLRNVMVISGTVTDKMAPSIKRRYDELPGRTYVISFGSCANSGGPYWDSYCVTKGVDQIIPIDVYVPGCPPRPEALLDGIRQLQALIATGET